MRITVVRVNAFAIGLAMLRTFLGIVISLLVIFAFKGEAGPFTDGMIAEGLPRAAVIAAYAFNLVLNIIVALLLFSPSARNAFALARGSSNMISATVDWENADAQGGRGPA